MPAWLANRGLGTVSYTVSYAGVISSINNGQPVTTNIGGQVTFSSVNQFGTSAGWHSLGNLSFSVSSIGSGTNQTTGSVSFSATLSGGQNMIADAMSVGSLMSNPSTTQGAWVHGGLQGNYYRRASGDQTSAATWTARLSTYQIGKSTPRTDGTRML